MTTARAFGTIFDPDAEKRSLMLARKVLCNGEATGTRCKHYWTFVRNAPSASVDFLALGEKVRLCGAWGDAEPLEFGEGTTECATVAAQDEKAPWKGCTRYRPAASKLVHIVRRVLRRPDPDLYDPSFEDYDEDLADAVQKRFEEMPVRPELTRVAQSIAEGLGVSDVLDGNDADDDDAGVHEVDSGSL